MKQGRASRTALRVAMRRAAHEVLDQPPVLSDPIAVPLLGRRFELDREREATPLARTFRAYLAARSRFAEDQLAVAVAAGVTQYAVLGAGLDTFAYRNPFANLRVFEVDHPATQAWKRELLAEAGIPAPPTLTFVPLDFERKTLADGLMEAGFDLRAPAFFGWLGVVPYLTLGAFRATLEAIAQLPAGTGVCFDYALAPAQLGPSHRQAFEALAARVAAAGEPFRLLYGPEEMEQELRRTGFGQVRQRRSDQLNELYFDSRIDDLRLPAPGSGMLAVAHV